MTELLFYTTSGCHLCEHAETLLQQVAGQTPITIQAIDIGNDEQLVARYGIKIPVLVAAASGRELCWPFSVNDIENLLTARGDGVPTNSS